MPTLNRYECIGRLGRNPSLGQTKDGKPVLRFSLAVDKSNGGDPLWLNIVVWEDLALRMNELLKKGMLIYLEGRLVLREFVPRGQDATVTTNHKLAVDIIASNIQILEKLQREAANEEHPSDA